MDLDIRRSGIEIPEEARERLARRLQFALGRIGRRVARIHVHFADEDGPRRGIDKRCTIVVRLIRGGEVIVEDHDAELMALLDRTANRAGQAVLRQMSRMRSH